ncbi:hypothetical protein GCM10028815_24020 [Mariniluteicoccus flavus]
MSQAVNDSGRMREETRVRIMQAADQLGWRPSSAARAVNGIQPMAVGLVVRRDTRVLDEDPFFASFLSGIETVASQHDLAVSLRFVTNQRDEDQAYRMMWSERAVRGFLVTDPRMDDHRLDLLHELEASVVVTGDPSPTRGSRAVTTSPRRPSTRRSAPCASWATTGSRTSRDRRSSCTATAVATCSRRRANASG